MKKTLEKTQSIIRQGIELAVPILCLGVVIQLIVGEPLLGWDVVGNMSKAIGRFGQTNFIGIAALLVLYTYIHKK